MGRIRTSLAVAALLSGGLIASPAQATIESREVYTNNWSDTFSDCGLDGIHIDHTESGTFSLRQITDGDAMEYLAHDNYTIAEVFTNPANGRTFSVTGNGNLRDMHGTHVEGTIWQFEAKNSGQLWQLRDGDGQVVWRDRGSQAASLTVDTATGEVLSLENTLIKGKYKDFYFCEDMILPYLG